ncbi:hypothetical protein ACJX0J_029315, partial [Zea mays]
NANYLCHRIETRINTTKKIRDIWQIEKTISSPKIESLLDDMTWFARIGIKPSSPLLPIILAYLRRYVRVDVRVYYREKRQSFPVIKFLWLLPSYGVLTCMKGLNTHLPTTHTSRYVRVLKWLALDKEEKKLSMLTTHDILQAAIVALHLV